MGVVDNIKKFQQSVRSTRDSYILLKGKAEQVLKQLKGEFGVTTIAEAKKKHAKMVAKKEELESKYETLIKKVEEAHAKFTRKV